MITRLPGFCAAAPMSALHRGKMRLNTRHGHCKILVVDFVVFFIVFLSSHSLLIAGPAACLATILAMPPLGKESSKGDPAECMV